MRAITPPPSSGQRDRLCSKPHCFAVLREPEERRRYVLLLAVGERVRVGGWRVGQEQQSWLVRSQLCPRISLSKLLVAQ